MKLRTALGRSLMWCDAKCDYCHIRYKNPFIHKCNVDRKEVEINKYGKVI